MNNFGAEFNYQQRQILENSTSLVNETGRED